jgi:Family of unknown function (DUF6311)
VRTALAGGLLGAALFVAVPGTAIVRPSNLGWTMRHDLQTYVLAWTHFRHESWGWPPGRIDGVGHPVGTSIGNTDAIPVVAFALKPFQALMPEPSQFLGAWLLLCFFLQGVFGVLLVRLATPDWRLQLLGAALFVQTPALFNRLGHPALCAHWLLLAAIWLVVDGTRVDRAWHRAAWLALAALVAAVQPYLAGMVLLLALGACANRAWRAGTWTRAAVGFTVNSAAMGLVMGGVFWLCGYFLVSSARDLQLEGLGAFSMNLLGPITGMGYSTLLPEIPLAGPGQYEGHVYFGMGWLLLALVAVALRVQAGAPVTRLGAAWFAVAACTAIAISPVVTVGASTIADFGAWAPASLATFRSSGRFGWVTMYTVFTLVALAIATRVPRRTAVAVFAAAVVVQGVDLSAAYRAHYNRERSPAWTDYDSPVKSAAWAAIVPAYRHLVMAPPDMCAAVWAPVAGPHLPFSLLAGNHGVTINSGNAGRYDTGAVLRYCATLEADMRAGRVSDDSLYVLSPPMRAALGAATPVPLACGVIDGFDVCVPAATLAGWRDAAAAAGASFAVVAPVR